MSYTIITGASGGIGRSTAKILSESGFNLILTDIVEMDWEPTLVHDNKILTFSLDVSNERDVSNFFAKLGSENLHIQGLVNLAGIIRDRTILKMSPQEWEEVIDINLKGTFLMMKEGAKAMRKTGGVIITTGSTAALHGNFGQANYVASKAGVEALTKTAAREFAKYNIRVNCVVPGFISTSMTDGIPEEYKKQITSQIPLNRPGKPEDVARVIHFLLSEESAYITGSSIQVDGGLRM